MASLYRVRALTTDGQQVRAIVKAPDMASAREALEERFPGSCVIAELCPERPRAKGRTAQGSTSRAISRSLASV